MSRRKQTETTQDLNDEPDASGQIVTSSSNRVLYISKSAEIHDGLDFQVTHTSGLSSDLCHLSEDGEVIFLTGNFYNIWSQHFRRDLVIPRNSQNGVIQYVYGLRTGKMNIIACAQHLNNCLCRINCYQRQSKIHKNINLVSTGRIIGMHVISPGALGVALFDQSNAGKKCFEITLFDIEKQTSCSSQERNLKALKLVASSFGDFSLVLASDTIYELQIDMYNKKIDLSQFELKRFLQPGELCVDACFLKDTIKLVLITDRNRIYLFDGRLLISKKQIQVPMEEIIPFQHTKSAEKVEEVVRYRKLSKASSIDVTSNQMLILFEDGLVALFKLENAKAFKFERAYDMPGETIKEQHYNKVKLVNGDVVAIIQKKNLQIWKMTSTAALGQENEHICKKISSLNYLQNPGWHLSDFCTTMKTLYTLHRDRVLRCWHLEKGLQYSKVLFQIPTSMSVHPVGFQMCISFKQLTRIYALKFDHVETIYTLKIRNISCVKYSPSGTHLLICDLPQITLINPYNYETYMIFQVTLSGVYEAQFIRTGYAIRNQHYIWLYDHNGVKQLQRKMSLYDFQSSGGIAYIEGKKLKLHNKQTTIHDKEWDIARFLNETQKITCMKIVQLYGVILFGTSEGYLIEALWPLSEQPNRYRVKVSNSPLILIRMAQTYKQLICVSQNTQITVYDVEQFIEGDITGAVYVFNHCRQHNITEDMIMPEELRRSLLNREYFLEGYGLTGDKVVEERISQAEEQTANLALIMGQAEYQKQNNKAKVSAIVESRKSKYQNQTTKEDDEVAQLRQKHTKRMAEMQQQLKKCQTEYAAKKDGLSESFDRMLLQQIKKSNELQATKKREQERLSTIMEDLRMKNQQILTKLEQDRQQKFTILVEKYSKLAQTVDEDRRKMRGIQQQGEAQQKLFRLRVDEELDTQLHKVTIENQQLGESIARNHKGVENFKLRAKYLQNLIEETERQVSQLEQDQQQYRQKTAEMVEQLKKKEQMINLKEEQIKKLLVENKHVKSFKDIHEYLMKEYTNETVPNQIRAEELELKVKQMNSQLLQEIEWRRQAEEETEQGSEKANKLRQERNKLTKIRQSLRSQLENIQFQLISMLKNIDPQKWLDTIGIIYDTRFTKKTIGDILILSLMGQTGRQMSQQEIEMRKKVDDLVRMKEDLSKKQTKEEAINKFQEKYKEQLFRKYHGENTELVKEFNCLQKQKKLLTQRLNLLKQSHALLQQQFSDGAMVRSSSVSAHRVDLKPTPFQRYERESSIQQRKKLVSESIPTTARQNPGSSTWLKSLIRQVQGSNSQAQTAEIVRTKVKSFVNPEMSRPLQNEDGPNPLQVFNKLSLENRQVRTKSELIKSLVRKQVQK